MDRAIQSVAAAVALLIYAMPTHAAPVLLLWWQGTELQELLQRHACDTLIIGGVMTNLCCEATARWVTHGGGVA